MADLSFTCDASDIRATMAAARRLHSRLRWPHNEVFIHALDVLVAEKRAVIAIRSKASVALLASPDLLDLLRGFEGKAEGSDE